MDLDLNGRHLHIPTELIGHICSFLEETSDVCNARLVNRCFCVVATKLITDIWHTPSLLFARPKRPIEPKPGYGPEYENAIRPKWVRKPITLWTWLEIPPSIELENKHGEIGRQFLELVTAPTNNHEAFAKYGRKAITWGRMQEQPDVFCIISQWDCLHSFDLYRASPEADALRSFLLNVYPSCVITSKSEWTPIAPDLQRHRPLFDGFYEVLTVHFRANMNEQQKRKLEATRNIHIHYSMICSEDYPGFSPWWWITGLRRFKGENTVAARFAFQWRNPELESDYKQNQTRPPDSRSLIMEQFEGELEAAGMIGKASMHFNFFSGPWRN